ncbi:hypothetical protein DU478_05845 [Thalassococcus profundi]|uniref:Type I restriction modification DNA specificity domain-containing protein n=1 Tax=Thalassococcus profundi TaxID=2282382 RepID=A0A369TR95_9RHOB|nr:restriction endonuclease subunit S [Thalassococcus profundi]RDD67254.1 hypothetical protein DU478_05845 [Thalassococcus profundi]
MSDLPQGWEAAKLGDILRIRNGFAFKSKDFRDEGIPLVRQTELTGDLVDLSKCKYLPTEFREAYERFLVKNGDILLGMSGSLGEPSIYQNDEPALQNQRTGLVEFDVAEQDLKDFALRALALTEREYSEKGKGIGVQNVSASEIESVSVPVPPLPEQRRIVAKLDRLSARSAAARDHLARTTKLATRAKQATLRSAFNGVLTGHSEFSVEPPNYDYYWPIPEGWKWRQVRDVGDVSLGRQRSPKNHSGPFMRPYIRAANITWRGIDTSDVLEMNFDAADFARFHLEPGDVLLNEGSGSAKEVGKPAIWHGEIEDCCFQNTVLRVKPKHCSSEYLYWYFYATALAEGFVSNTQGINIQHIGKKGLADFHIPHPPEDEQTEIVRRIEAAFDRIDRMTEEATRAAHLLDRLDERLLAKAFRGELVPQDPDDEPAEALLTRIREARAAAPKATRGRRKTA